MAILTSFLEAAAEFGMRSAEMNLVLHEGLEHVLVRIEHTAAAKIGHYQAAEGGFPAWAPLAEATLERKAGRGFAVPMPLRETGQMAESFGHEARGLEGVAGATDPKMLFHELGTSRMPARPVWGPAAFENREAIRALLGAALVKGITGKTGGLIGDPGASEWRYQIRV